MATLSFRSVASAFLRRNMFYKTVRHANQMMMDPLDHATGREKRLMLAALAGEDDPYHSQPIARGEDGGEECPIEIPSAFDHRFVGCICDDHAMFPLWMVLHKDCPTRCECGYWFKLVEKEPIG